LSSQKFTKSHLKSLVKECLLEILHEGADSRETSLQSHPMISESRVQERPHRREHTDRPQRNMRRSTALDNVTWDNMPKQTPNPDFSNRVKNITSQITSDPVLSDIFADTAMTTLQEQVGAERAGPGGMSLPTSAAGDNAARIAHASTPEELFSESAGKWAALAFGTDVNN
jgi:hypothetical protein